MRSDHGAATGVDDEARRCLELLRDGSPEEKVAARYALARIFTQRHMLREAADLYEANVRAGVRDVDLYRHLADVYARLGEADRAEAMLAGSRTLTSSHQHMTRSERLDPWPRGLRPRAAHLFLFAATMLALYESLGLTGVGPGMEGVAFASNTARTFAWVFGASLIVAALAASVFQVFARSGPIQWRYVDLLFAGQVVVLTLGLAGYLAGT